MSIYSSERQEGDQPSFVVSDHGEQILVNILVMAVGYVLEKQPEDALNYKCD